MQVHMFPSLLGSDRIEAWLARDLRVALDRATVSDPTPKPVQLPLYESGAARGFLEGRLVGFETQGPLRFLIIEGVFEGQPVRVAAEWNEVARRFDLEDTPLYLWRARRLPEEAWKAWLADLERLGLPEKGGVLGERKDGTLCHAEPTPENAWVFWLAAWRFGAKVGLDLGMRQERMRMAFAELKRRVPEIPDDVLHRSREAEGWGKAEIAALDE